MAQEQPQGQSQDHSQDQPQSEFERFVETIARLRAPDGCPWDKSQTHESIAHNMIEEAYEAADALEVGDVAHMREELGDVLLQVVLQSQIAADAGEFTVEDVAHDINEKMVRRHPHVFGDAAARNANEVLGIWDTVKMAEKSAQDAAADEQGTARKGLLDGVPTSFPALMQAQKISKKAVAAGFEWETLDDVWDQVAAEKAELLEAYALAPKTPDGRMIDVSEADAAFAGTDDEAKARVEAAQMEFGDLLFSLVNVGRRMGIDSERALRQSCAKFRARWGDMEGEAAAAGSTLEELPRDELEQLWNQAKRKEHAHDDGNSQD